MIASRHEIQLVALTMADGAVAVMQFIVRTWAGDVLICEREATDEAIQAEIDRTPLGQPVASWRRVDPNDIPLVRTDRAAWRDNGKSIAVDPSRVVEPEPDPRDAKIAALESRLAKLETATKVARLP